MSSLENYFNELLSAQKKEQKKQGTPYIGRVENPKGTCNTLWLPVSTSNRTATLNLNHTLSGFDKDGNLWGENGNCGTAYRIIEVPNSFKDEDLKALGEKVNHKFNNEFPNWYNALRASNADLINSIVND